MSPNPRETRSLVAYISAYEVHRAYGGPEEGGWYYDAYSLLGGTPFSATQEYEAWATDPEAHELPDFTDKDGVERTWHTVGLPQALDPEWLYHEAARLRALFGVEDPPEAQSALNHYTNRQLKLELELGSYEEQERPRYQ